MRKLVIEKAAVRSNMAVIRRGAAGAAPARGRAARGGGGVEGGGGEAVPPEQPANRLTHKAALSSMARVFFFMAFHSPIHMMFWFDLLVCLGTVFSIPAFCKVRLRRLVKSL